MEIFGSLCLGNDLVGETGTYQRGNKLSSRTGEGHRLYPIRRKSCKYIRKHSKGCLQRLAFCPCIMLLKDIPVFINNHGICTDRTNVNAYKNKFILIHNTPPKIRTAGRGSLFLPSLVTNLYFCLLSTILIFLSTLDKLSALHPVRCTASNEAQNIELQHRPLLSKLPYRKKSPVI